MNLYFDDFNFPIYLINFDLQYFELCHSTSVVLTLFPRLM